MALEAALFYTDAQGIVGENTISVRADSSEIVEVHHTVHKPTDTQSGRPTGARVHGAIKILKRIDKATPLLYKALTQNQNLPKLELKWYRPDPAGNGEIQHFYTIEFSDALVSKQEAWLPNTMVPEQAMFSPMEWVEFNYRTIIWRYEDGGIEHEDAWTERNV
ncbi:MAG TPA: type VI secretion system tube protein TssD [Rhodothermales bacterium]|nr:type VI secretion system tube protein TssD [Rhodothermales bacterium]